MRTLAAPRRAIPSLLAAAAVLPSAPSLSRKGTGATTPERWARTSSFRGDDEVAAAAPPRRRRDDSQPLRPREPLRCRRDRQRLLRRPLLRRHRRPVALEFPTCNDFNGFQKATKEIRAEDGVGILEDVLNDMRFGRAMSFYFVYLRLDWLWSLNLFALILLNFSRSLYGAGKMLYMLVIKGIFTLLGSCHASAKLNRSSMRGLQIVSVIRWMYINNMQEGKIKRRHREEEKWKKDINYAPAVTGSSSPGYYRVGSL